MSGVDQPRDEHEAADAVRRRLGNAPNGVVGADRPPVAVVLGSGLGDFDRSGCDAGPGFRGNSWVTVRLLLGRRQARARVLYFPRGRQYA